MKIETTRKTKRNKIIMIIAIILIVFSVIIFINSLNKKPSCKNMGVVYLKSGELSGKEVSNLVNKVGVVIIPEENQIIGKTELLYCPLFDEIYEDFEKYMEIYYEGEE